MQELLLPNVLLLYDRDADKLLTVRESSPLEERRLLREPLQLKFKKLLVLPTSSASEWEPSTDVMLPSAQQKRRLPLF